MIPLQHTIKQALSGKWASIIIILLVVIARIIQLTFFYNMNVDGMYQVMGMQNFVDGHGVSTSYVLPSDLSSVIYEPLIKWPPGYSLLLSPFYILFDHNAILAGLAVEILAAIVLIVTCRKILLLLETPLYLVNLFTLLTGFFIYSFYFICSSDATTITFFVIAIYFTLLVLKKDHFSLKSTIALSICLFLCGFIKYLFIPVVFIIPVFLFMKGLADKQKYLKKTAIISFTLVFITLAAMLLWQKITSGSATYISQSSRGFFPGNLKLAYPAIPASFVDPYSISMILPPGGLVIKIIFRGMQFFHLLFLFIAFTWLVKRIWSNGFKKITALDSFFYTGFFISVAISAVLFALSLTVGKEENNPGRFWTYVEEPRYYGLINVLVHLAIFLLYQYYYIKRSKRLKYVFIGLVLLLLPEFFRGVYFTMKRMIKIPTEEYIWQKEKNIQQYADNIIQKERFRDEAVAVTGSSYYVNYRVGIYSHVPAMPDAGSINDRSSLKTKAPVLLLVILQEKDFPQYQHFLENNESKLAGSFRGFYFYTTHVNPH